MRVFVYTRVDEYVVFVYVLGHQGLGCSISSGKEVAEWEKEGWSLFSKKRKKKKLANRY